LVLQRAWHLMPDARGELRRFHEWVDPEVQEWRTRLALRDGDWHEALHDMQGLGASQDSAEWRYWRARSLEAIGRKSEAAAYYIQLSRGGDYYAFLAADRAHLPYVINQQVSKPEVDVIEQLEARPGFTRARELVHADLYDEAEAEWQAATASLSTPARCQAALLAERWGWHARVIPLLAGGGCWQDLALTYPIAFEQTLVPEAKRLKLDLSWVYGLIRAESVFRPNAVSRVGARGLMQLMPGTGLDVASRLGLTLGDAQGLMDPVTNLAVGGMYLRDMLARFGGSEPLATAAYNAGPAKVEDWMPDAGALPADVWVDTIPYTETREYVHRVLGHTVIFDWRLNGKPEPLSVRLGSVAAAGADAAPVAVKAP
ncbi:MAG TPA: transglycosylase SLT domain-containing protein, partial [Gammaproteobacteria bacterium]|nr:transglycosylase SLT domain-containing protein [Gammaproteobacteria bacterium]